MELIAKISKGTKMDQIYIPKNRVSLEAGSYVLIKTLEAPSKTSPKSASKHYCYDIHKIEPIKLEIIEKIFRIINNNSDSQNIIITGSFLEKGFNFQDIDIIIISEKRNNKGIKNLIEKKIGIPAHLLVIKNENLIEGLQTDPLYQAMLSKCISQKRLIYKMENKPNYKFLDLHLLKSKSLIENFSSLTGKEKYDLIRNAIAIKIYLDNKKVTNESINEEIERILSIKVDQIKNNMPNKDTINIFRIFYSNLFNKVMKGIKNGSK